MNRALAITAIVVAAVALVAKDHLRWNVSASMPKGLYWISAARTPERGEVVTACLPEAVASMALRKNYIGAGDCDGRYQAVLKPVAAIAGDLVQVTLRGVAINGVPMPNSVPMEHDSHGRGMDLPRLGFHLVRPGEVWLISTRAPNSFDSRYFGPVPVSAVQGIATPLYLWER